MKVSSTVDVAAKPQLDRIISRDDKRRKGKNTFQLGGLARVIFLSVRSEAALKLCASRENFELVIQRKIYDPYPQQ